MATASEAHPAPADRPGEAAPLVRLTGAARFYGRKLVFRDVSLAVRPGEIWLVVGPNGAGKSTLLQLMAGLSRPDAGKAEIAAAPGRVGYLGHATLLYPRLTALANLDFWAGLYGLSPTQAELDEALAEVGLSQAAHERAGKFSRGMAQRLSLARVFLCRPELVLLDEPGTGLDARSLAILDARIRRARDEGAAVVWISHSVARDLPLADMVVSLENRAAAYVGPAAGFTPGGGIC